MGIFDSRTMRVLESALDLSSARHAIIVNNIANVNTPGYKAADIDFQSAFAQALAGHAPIEGRLTRPGHIPIRSGSGDPGEVATTHDAEGVTMRRDGNSVDIDVEMARLAENATMYSTLSQLVSTKFSMMKYVINEGRR
ncbi:MAG: flagellar basal body rod protein FlgB [Clostridia bacterium]|nr:flagellar basal body rod protein FlgB [Clostridia bacterium]